MAQEYSTARKSRLTFFDRIASEYEKNDKQSRKGKSAFLLMQFYQVSIFIIYEIIF